MSSKPIIIEVTETIPATPEAVYNVFADYRVAHPAILPKPYFATYSVEEGGKGAGTVFRAGMNVFGTKANFYMTVTEPEPGRVLLETDHTTGVKTTFTILPARGGSATNVTIRTESPASSGIRGLLERLMNPPITRRIYRQELQNLREYLASTGQKAA